MQIPIILILVALWAAFFLWPIAQRRLAGERRDSIGSFTKKVTVIGRVGGHRPARARAVPASPFSGPARPLGTVGVDPIAFPMPADRDPGSGPAGLPMSPNAQRRRRDALAVLAVAAIGSLLVALVATNLVVWAIHVAADLLLVGYVALLVHLRRRADERRAKVHFLPQPVVPSPALVLRRTVSS